MELLLKTKGIIIFYLALIAFTYVCMWRFERLEERAQTSSYTNNIVMNEK